MGALRKELYDDLEPPLSPPTGDSYTVSSNEFEISTVASTPESPDRVPKGFDDIAVQQAPTYHVDYLSHNWREEDIWASWKYVTTNRSEYANAARLENASWRTWMKSKNKLRTISPETLNWLKDCDVTWLYGPLQPGVAEANRETPSDSGLSKSASFLNKKPILKKRSMSEVMLQQSLSTASLVKQAAAAVQAQQNLAMRRPALSRAHTDFSSLSLAPMSCQNSLVLSSDTSGFTSPNPEKKHIHFNEHVEQCIAVDIKGEDEYDSLAHVYDESDSDGGIIMKTTTRKRRNAIRKPKKSALKNAVAEPKTIASLPSTTLKDRDDSLEPQGTAVKHSWRSPILSPSSSQETLRPSKNTPNFYVSSDSSDDESENGVALNLEIRSPTSTKVSTGIPEPNTSPLPPGTVFFC